MKIATCNVEFLFDEGIHTHSGKEWMYTPEHVEARIEHFSKLFSDIDADILLLQEVASESVIQRIIERTGLDYAHFFAAPDENGVGNVVLYKQKDAICESIPAIAPLPVFVEGDVDVLGSRMWPRRDFIHIETVRKGKKFHLLGIHIKSNFLVPEKNAAGEASSMTTQTAAADGLIRSEIFRFSQAKRVRQAIDSFVAADPDAHVLVAGDFNAEETNTVFRIIQGHNKKADDSLIPATKNIPAENRFSLTDKGRKWLVDHVLISKNLEESLVNAQILNQELLDQADIKNIAPNPTLIASDHAPVCIELK